MKPILTLALPQKLCAILCLYTAFHIGLSQETTQAPAQATTQTPEKPPALLSSHNQAALDLYIQLSKQREGQNLFFSPWSAHSLLWLSYAGTREVTTAEFAQALHLEQTPEQISQAYQEFAQALSRPAPDPNAAAPTLHFANALIHTSVGQVVTPQFQQLASEFFNAEIFAGDINAINHWVSGQTRGKIPRIFNNLPRDSSLVLLNALYFEGDWERTFMRKNTRTRPFYLAPGKSERVQMMLQTGQFKLYETEKFQLLQMPYENSTLSMCVLLPRPKLTSLAEIEAKLSAEGIQQFQTQLQAREKELVEIHLPRLKLNTQYNLKEVYQNLGIKRAFIPRLANFTGMGGGGALLYITHILQKAILEVNEEGTVAVAVTATNNFDPFGHPPEPPKPKIFNANHPFLFWIQEDQSGTLLFLGRYLKPEKD